MALFLEVVVVLLAPSVVAGFNALFGISVCPTDCLFRLVREASQTSTECLQIVDPEPALELLIAQ